MRNAWLDEAQVGIKNTGRNINSLRYADDTTLMAESEEELKSFLMKVKEESEKAGLKLNIQKTKIMAAKSYLQPSKKALTRSQLYCILILGFSLQNDVQLISVVYSLCCFVSEGSLDWVIFPLQKWFCASSLSILVTVTAISSVKPLKLTI